MPVRPLNPITDKLQKLIATGRVTKEKICVLCDLKYTTFQNIFKRNDVTKLIEKSLLLGGVITKSDIEKYRMWQVEQGLFGENRGRKRVKREKKSKDYENIDSKPDSELEDDFET